MKKITPKDRLEDIFSEATIDEALELLDYAGLMFRLKTKWAMLAAANGAEPTKRKYERKAKPAAASMLPGVEE